LPGFKPRTVQYRRVTGLLRSELSFLSVTSLRIMYPATIYRMTVSCGQHVLLGNVHDALTCVIACFQTEVCSSALTDVIHAVINGTDGCLFCFGHARLGEC